MNYSKLKKLLQVSDVTTCNSWRFWYIQYVEYNNRYNNYNRVSLQPHWDFKMLCIKYTMCTQKFSNGKRSNTLASLCKRPNTYVLGCTRVCVRERTCIRQHSRLLHSHPSYSRITVVGGKPPWPLGAESGSPQGYATTTPVATPQNQPNSTPRVLLSVTPPSSALLPTPDPFCRR